MKSIKHQQFTMIFMLFSTICATQPAPDLIASANFNNLWKLNDSIYRSEQPNEAGFKELELEKIRSILNLTHDVADLGALNSMNFSIYSVPMDAAGVGNFEIMQALRVIKMAPKPLLIHCDSGADRTGVVIALYRILFAHYSKKSALDEMIKSDFKYSGAECFVDYIDTADVSKLQKAVFSPGLSFERVDLDKKFDNAVEFSGITVKDKMIYIAEEKCKQLIQIKIADIEKEIVPDKSLRFKEMSPESYVPSIEGITYYNDMLLMTDETDPKVYYLTEKDRTPIEVKTRFNFKVDKGKMGLEGIAVNNDAKMCFVLKERNKDYRSEIRQFNIRQQGTDLWFDHLKTVMIQHPIRNPDAKENWRYSDICYDNKSGLLLCLKTFYFKKGSDRNTYIIDFLKTDPQTGLNQDNLITAGGMLFSIDISAEINAYKDKFNTNIEGIVVYNRDIYLVSDNKLSDDPQCDRPGEDKSLFLVIKGAFADLN